MHPCVDHSDHSVVYAICCEINFGYDRVKWPSAMVRLRILHDNLLT